MQGYLARGKTLELLAGRNGINAVALRESVARFNANAG
ncbi:hypothetical protein HNQ96_004983 [Aminobacter lissarensis]|uniref:Uncharacterized protein n=1 Tax=Aminobacter carboxidus TaxID=376165 RepID=A0A8E1WJN1_9HYPH|nr:hypothetical protein [Aminobacter lissarensis]